jgi:hypothetical protein
MPYKRKNNEDLFKSDEEIQKEAQMIKKDKKTNKIIPEKNNISKEITYEIEGNENSITKELPIEQTNSKKQLAKYIPMPEQFPVKMILGSPEKIRATASRIIKAGAKGLISQAAVNSLIWQLRSLVYFDTVNADLTIYNKLIALEKEVKKHEKG